MGMVPRLVGKQETIPLCPRMGMVPRLVGKQETMGFWSQNHFTLIPRSLASMNADPHSGSKVWKAPDREIGKPGENRGKVIAHRNLQPTAAFNDRENRS